MGSLPFYCRSRFAPILVGVSACVGALWFFMLHVLEPFDELDVWFYLCLYCGIGAISGLAAWYFARLVARQHASWFSIAVAILPAYLFVAFLALDKNPSVAALATLAAAFILLLVLRADHSTRTQQSA
jgi:hypothetical protein